VSNLERALVLWRRTRNPRVAELIDRLGAAALKDQKPLRASSAPKLAEALISAVKTKNPVELGRVLAAPWPKSWQAQVPIVQALGAAPEDPRIARVLAQALDQAPDTFLSRGARSFWWVLFEALKRQRDVRQLPLVEAQQGRPKTRYYRDYAEDWEAAAVDALKAVTPEELSKSDLKWVEQTERDFAGAVGTEKKRATSGAELLEQVWAHPTDLAMRSVYGDWLVEQGDPRGELIALQLGAPSEASDRKAHALIEKHWKKWLGPLSDWFAVPPRFEAGFPVAGFVRSPSSREGRQKLEPLLARPEWSTFRELSMEWDRAVSPVELLALPRFAAVAHLGNVNVAAVRALAKTRPALESLVLDLDDDDELPAGTWDAFAKLERVTSGFDGAATIASGLGKRTLPQVHLTLWSGIPPAQADAGWKVLDAANVGEVSLAFYDGSARATRSAPGKPFTRVEVHDARHFDTLCGALPTKVKEVVHTLARPLELEADDFERVQERLRRYASLTVKELPVRGQAPHAEFTLEGFAVFTEAKVLGALQCIRTHFGVEPDQFQVGWGGQQRAFREDDLVKAARNKSVSYVYLRREGSAARISFGRESVEVTAPVHDAEAFFAAMTALLALGKAKTVYLKGGDDEDLDFPASQLAKKRAEVVKYLRSVRA